MLKPTTSHLPHPRVMAVGVFILALSLFVVAPATSAQANRERELSISPLRTELVLAKGTSKSGVLTLFNTGKQPLTIQMSTQIFTVIDTEYNYSFDENAPANQWVRYTPANFILAPGKSKTVEYSVNVPITANPGDKYFSMFASTTPSQINSEFASTERVGSLIYLTVPGDITRPGKLLSIRSPFVATEDSTWSATIQNSGSALFRSNYSVSVRTLWGQELTKQEGSALILANSVRLVSDKLSMPQWIGLYNATYTLSLGDEGRATANHMLLYIPVPQLILLFTLLAALVLPIVTRHKKLSRKKKISSSEE